jgi:hypothetical protein
MKTRRWIALGALATLIAGCGTSSTYDYGYVYDSWGSGSSAYSSYTTTPRRSTQPALAMTDDRVASALDAQAQVDAERRLHLAESLEGSPETLYDVAARIDACFRAGQRDLGLELASTYDNVHTWDEASGIVAVDCRFRQASGGFIELTMARTGDVAQPLAVVLPPGTYGQPVVGAEAQPVTPELERGFAEVDPDWVDPQDEQRFRHWPPAQDLAFLRAPVVVFDPGQSFARAQIPVACAAFEAGPPQPDQPFTLAAFPAGSEIDKLMVALCANPDAGEAETQMAVWLVRNDVTWEQFVAQGGDWGRLVSFGGNIAVTPGRATGAADLMLEAGVDPRGLQFFSDHVPQAIQAEPQTDEPQQQEQEQQAQPEQPQADALEAGDLS